MAGKSRLFFWVDHEKEGPGVGKDEAAEQKRGALGFFIVFIQRMDRLVLLNLLYVLACFPVVTIGPATAAATKLWRNYARNEDSRLWHDFWDTFRQNWKQALPVGIVNSAVIAFLLFSLRYYYGLILDGGGRFSAVYFGIIACILIIFVMMNFYIYNMMITFDLKIRQLYKNALIFAIAELGRNFLTLFFVLISVAAFLAIVYFENNVLFWLFVVAMTVFLPSFYGLLICYNCAPVIKKYMIDPYEAKQRELHPELYEYENEEPVFEDDGRAAVWHDKTADDDQGSGRRYL